MIILSVQDIFWQILAQLNLFYYTAMFGSTLNNVYVERWVMEHRPQHQQQQQQIITDNTIIILGQKSFHCYDYARLMPKIETVRFLLPLLRREPTKKPKPSE
ncbi:hypothetical protein GQX74_004155 [Glossina fuscipes]|nr:hypothetical protein GQX74_004155 [Glossina fuscipes]